MRPGPVLASLLGWLACCVAAAGEETGSALFRGTQASDRSATIAGVRQTGLRCSGCHGRDAAGGLAGSAIIPPVDGDTLRRPAAVRPAYDEALFARALREGLRSDGQPLGLAMPRFSLEEAEIRALWRFLSEIEADERRGVEAERVRFAVAARPETREAAEVLRLSLERAWLRLGSPVVNGRRAEFVSIVADPSSGAFDGVFAVLGSEPGTVHGTELLDELLARGVPVVGPAHLPSQRHERLPDIVWTTRGETAVAAFVERGTVLPPAFARGRERRVISARDLADVLMLPEEELRGLVLVVSIFAVETPRDLDRLAATRAEVFVVRPASPFGDRDGFANLLARLVRDGLADSGRDLTRTRFLKAVAGLPAMVPDPAAADEKPGTMPAADFEILRLMPAGK